MYDINNLDNPLDREPLASGPISPAQLHEVLVSHGIASDDKDKDLIRWITTTWSSDISLTIISWIRRATSARLTTANVSSSAKMQDLLTEQGIVLGAFDRAQIRWMMINWTENVLLTLIGWIDRAARSRSALPMATPGIRVAS